METRVLVIAFILTCLLSSWGQAYAENRQFIRFYKINNKEQPTRLTMRRKTAEQAGCHNFRLKARVFQLNQIGYEYCSLYSEKDCKESSIINATERGSETAESNLTEGLTWYPQSANTPTHKRGVKIKSWYCKA